MLRRALEAMGGAQARDRIESTRASAKISMGTTGSSYEILTRRPGAFLVRQEIKGLGDMEIGCDGTTAWRSKGSTGRTTDRRCRSEAGGGIRFAASISRHCSETWTDVSRERPSGKRRTSERVLCDHVELTDGSNRISAYFDQGTGLLRAFDVKGMESRPMLRRVTIEEWSEPGTSEFLWARRLRIRQPGGTLEAEYRSVTFNDVAESNFELPVGISPAPTPEPDLASPGTSSESERPN